jgi:hypothetical protein
MGQSSAKAETLHLKENEELIEKLIRRKDRVRGERRYSANENGSTLCERQWPRQPLRLPAKGASSAQVAGKSKGYDTIQYPLPARSGQRLIERYSWQRPHEFSEGLAPAVAEEKLKAVSGIS